MTAATARSLYELPAEFDHHRDFFLWEHDDVDKTVESAFAYKASPVHVSVKDPGIKWFLSGLYSVVMLKHPTAIDFSVEYEGIMFRGHRIDTLKGRLLALRRVPSKAPLLDDLNLPPLWREILMYPELDKGGLIILAAVMGQGKSTTTAAMVRSRLERYAGYCLTIEDPCELPLHGQHGDGMCIQTPVPVEHGRQGFAEGLRSALRSYPTLPSGSMCLVGEVRDGETAAEVLRAAVNGTLVITTLHANTVQTAVARLLAMAEHVMGTKTARDLLAASLRVVIHQTLTLTQDEEGWRRGKIGGEILFSRNEYSPTASGIRNSGAEGLVEPIRFQESLLELKPPLRFSEFMKRLHPNVSDAKGHV